MRTSVICILAVSALAAPLASAAQKSIEDKAVDLCRQAKAKASSQDWERGPCVHNGGKDLPGWAVDVAHSPRQKGDDDAANQCSAVANGTIRQFVELDTDCVGLRTEPSK